MLISRWPTPKVFPSPREPIQPHFSPLPISLHLWTHERHRGWCAFDASRYNQSNFHHFLYHRSLVSVRFVFVHRPGLPSFRVINPPTSSNFISLILNLKIIVPIYQTPLFKEHFYLYKKKWYFTLYLQVSFCLLKSNAMETIYNSRYWKNSSRETI